MKSNNTDESHENEHVSPRILVNITRKPLWNVIGVLSLITKVRWQMK